MDKRPYEPAQDEPLPELKTDFGPDGPQPGTLAYTAFLMAQLDPGGDTGDPDFWDDWKDDMKEGLYP
jgi:hypothetical protein